MAPKIREKKYQESQQQETDRRVERLREDADTLEAGLPFRRMRAWLPVLTDRTASVCDWFQPDLVLLCEPDRLRNRTEERQQGFAEDLQSAMTRHEAVIGQENLLKSWDEVLRELGRYPRLLPPESSQMRYPFSRHAAISFFSARICPP